MRVSDGQVFGGRRRRLRKARRRGRAEDLAICRRGEGVDSNSGDSIMATEDQIAANRANAQRSTGPRTQAGKARSRYNATTHGLTGSQVLLAGEDPAEFEVLQRELFEDLQPGSRAEADVVSQLAINMWRLRRIPRIEAAMALRKSFLRSRDQNGMFGRTGWDDAAERAADAELSGLYPDLSPQDLRSMKALGELIDKEGLVDMTRLATYEDKISRQIDRGLKRLATLKAMRATPTEENIGDSGSGTASVTDDPTMPDGETEAVH